jgi:hypothetical protein
MGEPGEHDDFALLVTDEVTPPVDDPIDWMELPGNGEVNVDGIGFPQSKAFQSRFR